MTIVLLSALLHITTSCAVNRLTVVEKSSKASINKDSLHILDSLTTGYFQQSFLVDAPHSTAEHSIVFHKNHRFDYMILDNRYKEVDLYKGAWTYSNDSINISVAEKWTTSYSIENILDSSDRVIAAKLVINPGWKKGSAGYYTLSKDVLTYSYNAYRGGTVCFPKRGLSQHCFLKTTGSFMHEIENATSNH